MYLKKMANTRIPSLQAGIFGDDLCISFRIILHEILDTHVQNVLSEAKDIVRIKTAQTVQNRTAPPTNESFWLMFERGIKAVNTWDTQLKDRYRAVIAAKYRQISDLYSYTYLAYVKEMYAQAVTDVTVRVTIPSLSCLLYTFLRFACNDITVYRGEYSSSMPFLGRVMFAETIIRHTLYELLVQQNNIKSISARAPVLGGPAPLSAPPQRMQQSLAAPHNIVVESEENMHSQDLALGQRPSRVANNAAQPTSPLTMEEISQRLRSTTSSTLSQMAGPPTQKPDPLKFWDVKPPAPEPEPHPLFNTLPVAPITAAVVATVSVTSAASSMASETKPTNQEQSTPTQTSGSTSSKTEAAPAQSIAPSKTETAPAQPENTPSKTETAPAQPENTPSKTETASVQPTASEPAPSQVAPSLISTGTSSQPAAVVKENSITETPTTTAASAKTSECSVQPAPTPIFELAQQFTAHKPAGVALPPVKLGPALKENQVDSVLNLLPSNEPFHDEVQRLCDNGTSIGPYDSVTNIGQQDMPSRSRKSLFFP